MRFRGDAFKGRELEICVVKRRTYKAKVTIVLHVPYARGLIANGKGIHTATKKIKKKGTRVAVTVRLTPRIGRKQRDHQVTSRRISGLSARIASRSARSLSPASVESAVPSRSHG